jgi:hypothetical protein
MTFLHGFRFELKYLSRCFQPTFLVTPGPVKWSQFWFIPVEYNLYSYIKMELQFVNAPNKDSLQIL